MDLFFRNILIAAIVCCLVASCTDDNKPPVLFETLDHTDTNIDFSNKLQARADFNMLKYMYFYNGAGIGAADFNNDGLIDLFFSSNQGQNKLYLNKGKLEFEDVTVAARIPDDGGWSTGISVVDINSDGLLDIYVCRVGRYETLNSVNQLLVCTGISRNGIPSYRDEAKEYGLDFKGFSTQAAFFDFDLDGDLDMYLLNHSLRYNSTFYPRARYEGTYDSLSGDRLYRRDGDIFTDVTRSSGINSTVIGYGLGIAVSDINLDGYPDIYIGNDFHENDYLYINQKNGTFKDALNEQLMHTSQFSMGVDVADINNDAYPEIITVDMLPSDPYMLKRSLGEDEYNTFYSKIRHGYNYQYARNTLQLSLGENLFSEIGLYSGVYATDWSWAPLWVDFDNDGLKDLFVSNGIPKRLNDIDYVNYVSNDVLQEKISMNKVEDKDLALIDRFPQIKLPNRFFRNSGNVQFTDAGDQVKGNSNTFSNGAVYADLDNDGDLDIVVNNIDEPVLVYKNNTSERDDNAYLQVEVKGKSGNMDAIGAKLVFYSGNEISTYEKFPVRGFQSSMEIPLHAGLKNKKIDSVHLIWPDNSFQKISLASGSARIRMTYTGGLPQFAYESLRKQPLNGIYSFEEISGESGLLHKHEENTFIEFDREPLIPFMVSREGPGLAVGDINGDGLDDVFVGSAKGEKSAVYVQHATGKFQRPSQPALEMDSTYEDVYATWVDVNNDSFTDLIVTSGGNEYYNDNEFQLPRVYINDGKAKLSRLQNAFPGVYVTASCIIAGDFNKDGHPDLFLAGRALPWEYGQTPRSYLLQNDGSGRFTDVTSRYCKELVSPGLVKHAVWADIDGDKDDDLVLSIEWGTITAYINGGGRFTRTALTTQKGWWNFTLPCDIDNDGDLDLLAGNLGWNSRLQASPEQPVKLYFNDFDGNGRKEQVLTYFPGGREMPFANKAELEKQMPVLKKQFLYADDLAKASLSDIFAKDKLKEATVLSADYFSNAILINKGNLQFELKALPWQAQLTSYRDAATLDVNEDNLPDFLLGGNFYENNIQMGRYDADYGTLLINLGKGQFRPEKISGVNIKGQVRYVRGISIAGKQNAFILAQNNDSIRILKVKEPGK